MNTEPDNNGKTDTGDTTEDLRMTGVRYLVSDKHPGIEAFYSQAFSENHMETGVRFI